PAEELAVSQWTCVEFSSLLARNVRMRITTGEKALEADREFDDLVRRSFLVIAPSVEDFDQSRKYLRNYKTRLRAGDAFHLAIARLKFCSAISTVRLYFDCNSLIVSMVRLTRIGASPTDGSSTSRMRGALISARASASICCSPPLIEPASWLRRSFNRPNMS